MDLQSFYKQNQDEIEDKFDNHIQNRIIDGDSDAGRLAQSESYFWEWLEESIKNGVLKCL